MAGCADDRVIDAVEGVDGFLRCGDRVVGTEEEFVEDVPFGGVTHGVVVGPGAIEVGGDIGIDVRMFADDDIAVDLPRVGHVGQDHLEVREGGGDAIDMAGVSEIEIGESDRRGALVEEDREARIPARARKARRLPARGGRNSGSWVRV